MGVVICLPGCCGSELFGQFAHVTFPIWADRDALRKNGLTPLTLDGTQNALPAQAGLSIVVGRALQEYYQAGFDELASQLLGTPFQTPRMYQYDWRLSMLTIADQLVTFIESVYTTGNPVTLVGHSQGGLIARLAYYRLNGMGKAAHVRRIITLGTPHQGTARIMQVWQGNSDEGLLLGLVAAIQSPFPGLFKSLGSYIQDVINVTMTWPSWYELLPMNQSLRADFRAAMATVYTQQPYFGLPSGFPSPFRNELAQAALQGAVAFLSDGVSVPSGRKLVCVEGRGYPTPYVRVVIESGKDPRVYVATDGQGDGTTLYGDGTLPSAQQVSVECPHDQLFARMCFSNRLASLIQEDFDPAPEATTPSVHLPLPPPQDVVQPPPFATIPFPEKTPPEQKRARGRPKTR
jgi:pimeloyl-ACP methyl ester carboxylesterase